MRKLQQFLIVIAVSLLCLSCSSVPSLGENPWKVISIDTDSIFADVAFTDDPEHGWLVGTKSSLFETKDGGDTWQKKILALGDEKVSLGSVSFHHQEGWIVGKPSILLRTEDGGSTWSRIPLSEKLPGAPYGIVALGDRTAEMVTDLGAIYRTEDGGKTWKALVEGAVGVARTIVRSDDGQYVAVSARGNFYSTWKPGATEWNPHNRLSSRRLQKVGFNAEGGLWALARGGQLQFTSDPELDTWEDKVFPEFSASWGLLDLTFRTPEEIWIAGGSGNLLVSHDGGGSWEKDRAVESVPSNLYRIVFVNPDKGFILGQNGVLLKYDSPSESA